MKTIRNVFLSVLLLVSVSFSDLTIAVASNMQEAMEEIKDEFRKTYNCSIKAVYNASGKLAMQICHGAPFDLFISADMCWPESLFTWKLTSNKPEPYAFGYIVLWTVKDIDISSDLFILNNHEIKSIAIGDLSLTVYGPAAKKLLQKTSIWSLVSSKVVYGNNISQVAHYILTGAADLGFAAKSTVLSKELKSKGKWIEFDSTLSQPIPQGMIKLNYGMKNHPVETDQMYRFMSKTITKAILKNYGYKTP